MSSGGKHSRYTAASAKALGERVPSTFEEQQGGRYRGVRYPKPCMSNAEPLSVRSQRRLCQR